MLSDSWNQTLFSDPAAFVQKLHESRGPLGIKVAVNTHPDEGIDACQNNYVRTCYYRNQSEQLYTLAI
jgi:hypothetical protein